MIRWKFLVPFALVLGVLAMIASPALALLVRPVVIELTSSGPQSGAALEVVNDRNVPMTVEIAIQDLVIPEKGAPVITPSQSEDFMIFPTIARIAPGARQIFRVRYVGENELAKGKLFMFSTSELPISAEGGDARAQVEVLYSINSVVAVREPGAAADISLSGVTPATNSKGETGLELLFENKGTAHGFLGAASMKLTNGDWETSLDANAMSKAFGLGLIPARSKRVLFLPMPDAPEAGAYSGTVKPVGV